MQRDLREELRKSIAAGRNTHLFLDSSSVSKELCLLNSSIRVCVTSFSRSVDSDTAMGGVTPR